jgi:hypothetical protein
MEFCMVAFVLEDEMIKKQVKYNALTALPLRKQKKQRKKKKPLLYDV